MQISEYTFRGYSLKVWIMNGDVPIPIFMGKAGCSATDIVIHVALWLLQNEKLHFQESSEEQRFEIWEAHEIDGVYKTNDTRQFVRSWRVHCDQGSAAIELINTWLPPGEVWEGPRA